VIDDLMDYAFPRASQALSRFTVLDLTRVRAGPTCVLQGGGNRELAALSDFRWTVSPSVLPVPLASHRLGLLAAAMIFSLLPAFGTIVALQKFQTNSYWRGDQSDSSPETETSSGEGTRDSLANGFNPLITSVPKRSMVIKAEMD
jgi:hypothetical protein